jgi:hypothetical protein
MMVVLSNMEMAFVCIEATTRKSKIRENLTSGMVENRKSFQVALNLRNSLSSDTM